MNSFHAKTIEQTLKIAESRYEGLTNQEAKERMAKFGLNEIPEKKALNPIFIFLKQFHSWLIYILIGAAVFSFLTNHLFDVFIIIVVLLFNSIMGFIQESKAEKSIKALKKMVVSFAKVIRGGNLLKIPSTELVPGDIILLEEGDRIPADARLLETKYFKTMESALTGESISTEKTIEALPEKISLIDQKNMVWMGTFAVAGQAKAVITATGLNTALGKIAKGLEQIKTPKTHFKEKTDLLAKQMAGIAFACVSILLFAELLFGKLGLEPAFRFAVAALVSAIPEGLPIVLVVVLAVGAHRMAKKNAIIRNLQATETLGVTNVIAADKTGTITQNVMNVRTIILPEQSEMSVSGEGWTPKGEFTHNEQPVFPLENPLLRKFLHIASISNNARIVKEEGEKETYKIIGDPTEGALVVLAEKAGLKKDVLLKKEKKIDEQPFSTQLKYSASLSVSSENKEEKKEIYVAGAPEAILELSNFKKRTDKKAILNKTEALAKKGLRVIALAYKPAPKNTEKLKETMIKNLNFAGLAAMKDPARPGVKEAIAKAKQAGIRVIMKTGDHKETAVAISKEIGLIDEKEKKKAYPLALTEKDLENLSEKEFDKTVKNVAVFARLTPQMKLKILESLQKQNYIVAMTGDGVNDALALKKANIGIAMGQAGTDVARENSSMVLADDNFSSIVNAVEEGRTVFINVKQVSLFLITTNVAEIITFIFSLIFGIYFWGKPFLIILPAAILFLNLVTDGFADVGLALEPRHENVMSNPPRKKQENIIGKEGLPYLAIMVPIMVFLTILVFKFFLLSDSLEKARAGAFAVMAITQLFNVFNMRSLSMSIFKIGFFSNKFIVCGAAISFFLIALSVFFAPLANKFGFFPLSFFEFLFILTASSLVLWTGEIYKYAKKFKTYKQKM